MIPFRHVINDLGTRIIALIAIIAALAFFRSVGFYKAIIELIATRSPQSTVMVSDSDLRTDIQSQSLDTGTEWSAIFVPSQSTSRSTIPLRYRLAGTFLVYGGLDDQRRAVIDDSNSGIQVIVSEGDLLSDGSIVGRIRRDSATLKTSQGIVELRLVFQESRAGEAKSSTTHADEMDTETPPARFGGQQVAHNRWYFDRQKLLDYYAELRDEPARLVAVFDSMKPVYNEDDTIEGYRLVIEGEADFFAAVGLSEHDIVRAVNSVEMTNRRRAEHFIREFVADRANIFVLDVERNGHIEKLIYQVQQPE